MSEQVRKEFEEWAEKESFNIARWRDGYDVVSTNYAWQGWQASRQALVVELPRVTGDAVYDAQEVHDALGKAGAAYR
jgi:hypothetical protein